MSFNITIVLSVIGAAILIALFGYIIMLFNNYVRLKNLVKKAQANIDVLLKQRFDELPKLIAAVKGYMKHESETLQNIADRRSQIMSGGMASKAVASNQIQSALKSVFAVAEQYPDLKANESFKQLQERISSIETEISQRREFYNSSVNNHNIWVETFPNNMIGKMFGAKVKELFQTNDTADVKVQF